ncbi:MAG: hypothetical protein Fur006_39630 [Coleofasciculaceae cyanobacterium]
MKTLNVEFKVAFQSSSVLLAETVKCQLRHYSTSHPEWDNLDYALCLPEGALSVE